MRVLHIWDTAGVGFTFTKYLKKLGHEALTIHPINDDPFLYSDYYKNESKLIKVKDKRDWTIQVVKEAKDYDIVHVHSRFDVIPTLRYKYPKKPIVLEYHGGELRFNANREDRKKCHELCDLAICSTEDLLDYQKNMIYVPNPVDMDHFRPLNMQKSNVKYLRVGRSTKEMDQLREYLKKNNQDIELDFLAAWENSIPYSEMPYIYNRYDYYLDIKFNKFHHNGKKPFQVRTKASLEALACGLKVVTSDFEILDKLPEKHEGLKSTSYLVDLYTTLIE